MYAFMTNLERHEAMKYGALAVVGVLLIRRSDTKTASADGTDQELEVRPCHTQLLSHIEDVRTQCRCIVVRRLQGASISSE